MMSTSTRSLITSQEACEVSDAFLLTLYGRDVCDQWRQLKYEMEFVLEKEFVTWLIDVAYQHQQCKANSGNGDACVTKTKIEMGNDSIRMGVRDKIVEEQKPVALNNNNVINGDIDEKDVPMNCSTKLNNNNDITSVTSDRCVAGHAAVTGQFSTAGTDISEPVNLSSKPPSKAAAAAGAGCGGGRGGRRMSDVLDKISRRLQSANAGGGRSISPSSPTNLSLSTAATATPSPSDMSRVDDATIKVEPNHVSSSRSTSSSAAPPNTVMNGDAEDMTSYGDVYDIDCEEIYLSDECSLADLSDVQNMCSPSDGSGSPASSLYTTRSSSSRAESVVSVSGVSSAPVCSSAASPLVHMHDQVVGISVPSPSQHTVHHTTTQHTAQHTMTRCPYYPTCPYSSHGKSNMTRHVRAVHDKLKPWRCPQCDYRAAEKGNMTKHIRKVHEGGGVRPYTCDTCGYQCADRSRLAMHVAAVHHGTRPHACPHCAFRSTERNKVLKHIRIMHLPPAATSQPTGGDASLSAT